MIAVWVSKIFERGGFYIAVFFFIFYFCIEHYWMPFLSILFFSDPNKTSFEEKKQIWMHFSDRDIFQIFFFRLSFKVGNIKAWAQDLLDINYMLYYQPIGCLIYISPWNSLIPSPLYHSFWCSVLQLTAGEVLPVVWKEALCHNHWADIWLTFLVAKTSPKSALCVNIFNISHLGKSENEDKMNSHDCRYS